MAQVTAFSDPSDEIHLHQDNFQNDRELRELFEKLYLGPTSTYRLFFSVEWLPIIHQVFDQIIREHGLRDVNFDFEVDGFIPAETEA